ncbi:ATPase, V1 complex, subunit H [Pilobolus umbonatus]|nr:ATPase, V1 complex, subunit H [Pilobolus umbonatus]
MLEDIKVTIIAHPYLDETLRKIKNTDIPWEQYQQLGLITEYEVAMIKYVEKKSSKELSDVISEHGRYYAALYLELMQKLARVDALQKVLVLIHEMLDEHEERIALFHEAGLKHPEYPFSPFHKALRINDEFIGVQSSKILTLLICSTPNRDIDIKDFFRWVTFQLQSQQQHIVDLNIQILGALFHIPEYRKEFWDVTHAVDSLVNIMKAWKGKHPQRIYEVTYAIWLLSFNEDVARHLDRKCQVIPTLVEIAKAAVKEKVIRVVISTFRNLIEKAPAENMATMLASKLLPLSQNLATRKWIDNEIMDDIAYVNEQLQSTFHSLTTFEVYASELESGILQWSPSHRSETFWKQNANRLNEENEKWLRLLARLLHTSNNPLILAIACHDLGQYVKYSTHVGRRHFQLIGAKQKIMELMTHEDADVRYYALSATQKYFAMTTNSSNKMMCD